MLHLEENSFCQLMAPWKKKRLQNVSARLSPMGKFMKTPVTLHCLFGMGMSPKHSIVLCSCLSALDITGQLQYHKELHNYASRVGSSVCVHHKGSSYGASAATAQLRNWKQTIP